MSTATEQGERGSAVARFFGALQERWWLILCTVIIAGGIAFGVSLLLESKYATAADIIYSAGDAEEVSKPSQTRAEQASYTTYPPTPSRSRPPSSPRERFGPWAIP